MQKVIYLTSKVKGLKEKAYDYFLNAMYAPEAKIEAKVGGKYETYWNPPEREDNSTIGCKITALEEKNLLAFEWKGPVNFKHFMNNCDPLTHVTIFFSEEKKENEIITKVYLLHTGWGPTDEWEEARVYFVNAWKNVLLAFERYMQDK
ncbi:MAG: SRPBCC domain-containing protein [Asgard group archaeon]|nr:SRPBCC domain-containing protein [Asgard group archaeon]